MNGDNDSVIDFVPSGHPERAALLLRVNKLDIGRHGIIAAGTTYKDAPYSDKPFVNDASWGSYVFLKLVPGTPTTLMFGPPLTTQQITSPFRESFGGVPPETWPPVLRRINPKQDSDFPLATTAIVDGQESIVNAPRNYVTVDYVPAVRGGRVLTRLYFSPTVHNIPRHETPVPTAVNWDIPGANDFYVCLHDDIYVRPVRTGSAILVGAEARALSGTAGGEFFPATNFKTWQPYVFDDFQEETDGGFLRTEKVAIPPSLPKLVRDII